MKKVILAFSCLLCGFMVGACSDTVSATQEYPLTIWKHNENGTFKTLCVTDRNTGVNYVVVATQLGNEPTSVAITPRLNADGSLYVE